MTMYSDLDRKMLVVPWTIFAGRLSAEGSETTKDEVAVFRAPSNGVIVGWSAAYVNEGGTAPVLDLTIERGTTVLDTLSQLTTDETLAFNDNLEIKVSRGDTLNIKGDVNNTDNFFDGLVIVLAWQPLANV
jgi:hypothetical protein